MSLIHQPHVAAEEIQAAERIRIHVLLKMLKQSASLAEVVNTYAAELRHLVSGTI